MNFKKGKIMNVFVPYDSEKKMKEYMNSLGVKNIEGSEAAFHAIKNIEGARSDVDILGRIVKERMTELCAYLISIKTTNGKLQSTCNFELESDGHYLENIQYSFDSDVVDIDNELDFINSMINFDSSIYIGDLDFELDLIKDIDLRKGSF